MIIWLTGQPGSGKTTLAKEIMLSGPLCQWYHVDGDDIRELFDNKDYSEQGRRKNIELAQQLAQYLDSRGKKVVVSLVSPYKDQRDKFKEKMGDNLFEVYVYTNEIRGREDYFVKDYEPPTEKYLRLDTTKDSVEESTRKIIEYAENSR
jgi:adenylylsulfate kinase